MHGDTRPLQGNAVMGMAICKLCGYGSGGCICTPASKQAAYWKEQVESLERSNAQLLETLTALRNGEEAPTYCYWCGEKTSRKLDDMADHMLSCEKAPHSRLADQVVQLKARLKEDEGIVASALDRLEHYFSIAFGVELDRSIPKHHFGQCYDNEHLLDVWRALLRLNRKETSDE